MTKKQIVILLSPILAFILIAAMAFWYANQFQRKVSNKEFRETFHRFAANVESGKWELTKERWLEGMRRGVELAEANQRANQITIGWMKEFIWVGLFGVLCQIVAVVYVVVSFDPEKQTKHP